ncbi:MAG: accessory factor associated with RNA polymerase II [Caeruleum heppii]|nr:MAG: accessory factor associated with RNA polymerase II [Caeruleum heppii]
MNRAGDSPKSNPADRPARRPWMRRSRSSSRESPRARPLTPLSLPQSPFALPGAGLPFSSHLRSPSPSTLASAHPTPRHDQLSFHEDDPLRRPLSSDSSGGGTSSATYFRNGFGRPDRHPAVSSEEDHEDQAGRGHVHRRRHDSRRRLSHVKEFQSALSLVREGLHGASPDTDRPRRGSKKGFPRGEQQGSKTVKRRRASSSHTPKRQRKRSRAGLGDEKDGLYRRSITFLTKLGHIPFGKSGPDVDDSLSTTSKTAELLDRATTWLKVLIETDTKARSEPTKYSPPSDSSARTKTVNFFSHKKPAVLSRSSSVIHLMMGKPPKNSPDSTAMYTGQDRKQYLKVEISDPDGPTYLPSEATRVGTPPGLSDRDTGRKRGYFFDLNAPGGESPEDWVPERSADERPRLARAPTLTRWYGVRLDDEAPEELPFELDVPEHLPNSPLCPANVAHPSRGKGICVYHGRGRSRGG